VREAGRGPAVVLVHGLGVSGTYFVPLARLLAEGRRVIAPDLPGFGQSERPPRALDIDSAAAVLATLLTNEDVDTPLLVANSLGCQIVIELARRKPALVGGLVLIGPTVDPRYRSWIRQLSALTVDWWREPPSLWPIILRDYLGMGGRRLVATARFALADCPETKLPEITAPVLVLRGARDALSTNGWAERCAALAQHGSFVTIPAAAHAAHFSHPDLVAAVIEPFLAECIDGFA
jgi:pimeloyl-ACP methyl ester carboxylesterase